MTDNEKYVFKLYNIGTPTRYGGDILGDDAISDKLFMSSPYRDGGSNQAEYEIENYHKLNEEIREGDDYVHNKDLLNRRSKPIEGHDGHFDEDDEEEDGDIYLPHRGISVIGLHDPRFSFYNARDMSDPLIEYVNNTPRFNKRFINSFDKKTQSELLYMLNNFAETELDNFNVDLSKLDKQTLESILSNALYAKNFVLSSHLYTDDKNFRARSPKTLSNYDFGYGNMLHGQPGAYQRLLERIALTQNDTKANGLVLATVPESALYNVHDVIAGKLRAQRDYPEELVVRKLVPRKVWDTNHAYVDYDDNDSSPIFKSTMSGNNVDIDGVIAHLKSLENDGKSAEYRDEWARDYINQKFEIDPDQIHSDETKKFIFDDLSNWYKGYSDKKESKHSNILSGIKELGQ